MTNLQVIESAQVDETGAQALANGADRLVTTYDATLSASENLANAGLLWRVERARAMYQHGSDIMESDIDLLVRSDNGRVLGNVLQNCDTTDNRRSWAPSDNLPTIAYALETAERYDMRLARMINFRGGEAVAFELHGESFDAAGHEHRQALTIRNYHNGRGSLQAIASLTNMICNNGQWHLDLSAMIARIVHRGNDRLKIRRSGQLQDRVAESLAESRAVYLDSVKTLESIEMPDTIAAKAIAHLYGVPASVGEGDYTRARISNRSTASQVWRDYRQGAGQADYGDNALKVLNGITHFETHSRGRESSEDKRLDSALFGSPSVSRAWQALSDYKTNKGKVRDKINAIEIPALDMWDEALTA